MDRAAWWAAVHGVVKSRTRLSDFPFHFHALEREMAAHSSVLAWRIPGTGEPGGLPSGGSQSRTRPKRLGSSRSVKRAPEYDSLVAVVHGARVSWLIFGGFGNRIFYNNTETRVF